MMGQLTRIPQKEVAQIVLLGTLAIAGLVLLAAVPVTLPSRGSGPIWETVGKNEEVRDGLAAKMHMLRRRSHADRRGRARTDLPL
jgi:hypothetical protein